MNQFVEAEQLQRIGDMLESKFKKPDPVPLPKATQNYANAIKLYFDRLDIEYQKYELELERLEPCKGSEYYKTSEQAARAEYTSAISSARQKARELVSEAVEQMRQNYQNLTQKTLPTEIMQQLQVFNMLKHPTAEQYERYQEAFSDYPSAQEILCSKYNNEAKPITEIGIDSYGLKSEIVKEKGYTPYYASGMAFSPKRILTYGKVNSLLTLLEKNACDVLEIQLPGNLASNELLYSGQYIKAAMVRSVLKSETPEAVMGAVTLSDDGEISDFLKQTDRNYIPSSLTYTVTNENGLKETSTAVEFAKTHAQKQTDAVKQSRRIIDDYIRGNKTPEEDSDDQSE